jgi:hypothetical protein
VKTRSELYAELLELSKAQRTANIQVHTQRATQFKAGKARRKSKRAISVPLDFLALGDSWFEYPIYNNGPWFEETGIVSQVQLQSMGNPPPVILNLALHGATTTEMLSWENQDRYISVLQDPSQWMNGHLPDAILVSAGGDDFVGDQLAVYLDYNGGGLNMARFTGALDSVQASYMDLFAFRDIFAPKVQIYGHCYDYAIPNNVTPICVSTAWLWPSFQFAGYTFTEALSIVTEMIDEYEKMLAALAAKAANRFTLIDTRRTLIRDSTSPTGWANEIHPYFAGFTALANKFLLRLQNDFPDKI